MCVRACVGGRDAYWILAIALCLQALICRHACLWSAFYLIGWGGERKKGEKSLIRNWKKINKTPSLSLKRFVEDTERGGKQYIVLRVQRSNRVCRSYGFYLIRERERRGW